MVLDMTGNYRSRGKVTSVELSGERCTTGIERRVSLRYEARVGHATVAPRFQGIWPKHRLL
jgi:hypothetical protein